MDKYTKNRFFPMESLDGLFYHRGMQKLDRSKLLFDRRYLSALIIPLVIEMVLNVSIGMVDTMMVAQAGESAVSGVSCVDSLQQFMVSVLTAFGTGGAVVVSQYLGKKDEGKARFAAKELLYIAFSFAFIIGFILISFRRTIIHFIYGTLEEDVFNASISYLFPIALSLPFLSLQSTSNAISRTNGKTSIVMVVSLVMNVINIVGNAVFLFVFHLGALGVGLATLLSRIAGATIMLFYVTDRTHVVRVERIFRLELDFTLIKTITKVAVPTALESSIFQLGKIFISSTIALLGTASIAAYAVIVNISQFSIVTGQAVGMASVTVVGQCVGAREFDQAKYYAGRLLMLSYGLIIFMSLGIMGPFMPQLIGIYNLSEETTAMALMVGRMFIITCSLIWPLSFTIPNFLKGAGDVRFTMVISTLSMWVFRITLARVLTTRYGYGLDGVYYGWFADWYFRAIVYSWRFLSGRWKTKAVV